MPRKKKIVIVPPEKSDLPVLMKQYKDAESELKKIQAEKELKIAKIRQAYMEKEMGYDSVLSLCFDKLEAFAHANRDQEFSKKKSLDLSHGTIGYRIGQWKVKQAAGFKVAQSLELLKEAARRFVRIKEEIDKDAIINERSDSESIELVKQCGLLVEQDESFYIKTKEETLSVQ